MTPAELPAGRPLAAEGRRVLAAPMQPGILADLSRMNEALDMAIAEAVDRFSRLRERDQAVDVERAASFRERFIGIVSHDLRTPSSAIAMGATRMLHTEAVPPHIGTLAGRVLVNTERMAGMISDLLDLTRGRLGGGIPPDELPHLFDAFRRAKAVRSSEGLGLGLFIASEIVRAHGGRIRVESTEAQGTTFTVNLPRDDRGHQVAGLSP